MDINAIVEKAEHLNGRANRTAINKAFREADQSHLWPICGKFNATERAIRSVQSYMRESGEDLTGYEYAYALDEELLWIVNFDC